jgi:hypothetical protein
MNTTQTMQNKPYTPRSGSLASMAGAAVLTLAMLLGVNTLAVVDAPAPQLAQATSTQG